jgi:hypothetical protein
MGDKRRNRIVKRKFSRWISIALAVTMLLGLLPPLPATAAGAEDMIINGVYLSNEKPNLEDVPIVTTVPYTIVVTVPDLASLDITQFEYEIWNATSGNFYQSGENRAAQRDARTVAFSDVYLTEGLNRITITYAKTVSRTGWIFYAPVANIVDLTVNDIPIDLVRMVPEQNPTTNQQTRLRFAGRAPNATSVRVQLHDGQVVTPVFSGIQSQFFFTADLQGSSTIASDFKLQPGDNEFTIEAINAVSGKSYNVTRKIVYNPGGPFVFNGQIEGVNLISKPVVSTADGTATITGALAKVDLVPDNNNNLVLKYNQVQILVPDESGSMILQKTIDLTDSDQATEDAAWSGNEYKVYKLKKDIEIEFQSSAPTQKIEFRFSHATDTTVAPVSSFFTIRYQNTNQPYIDRVTRPSDPTEIVLSDQAVTEINGLPYTLYVYANEKTTEIELRIGGQKVGSSTNSVAVGTSLKRFEVQIGANAPKGRGTLQVIPYSNSGEATDKRLEYPVMISTVPYAILENVTNGMQIRSESDLACGNQTKVICGRLVNYSEERYEAYITINNNNVIELKVGTNLSPNGVFTVSIANTLVADRKNTIQIVIKRQDSWYENYTSTYEIFYLGTSAPRITQLTIVDASGNPDGNFTRVNDPNREAYTTSKSTQEARFKVKFENTTDITLRVYRDDQKPAVSFDRWYQDSSNNWTQEKSGIPYLPDPNTVANYSEFTTNAISLSEKGETRFEFVVRNNKGTSITYTVVIAKLTTAYEILEPQLGPDGRAIVNSNHVLVKIQAEGARAVLFGKEQAAACTDASNQIIPDTFCYTVEGLKAGNNSVKFTIDQGTGKLNGSFDVYYVGQVMSGATYLTPLKNKLSVFDGTVQLSFPKGTSLVRYDKTAANRIVPPDWQLLFGIADSTDGRIDKSTYTSPNSTARDALTPPPGFQPVSGLIWIDAGSVDSNNPQLLKPARDPYAPEQFWTAERYRSDYWIVPSQPGELTLKFDSSIRSDAWRYLTVAHFEIPEDGIIDIRNYNWEILGGTVDTKRNEITVPITKFGFYQVFFWTKVYDDIRDSWARNDIETVVTRGIMKGQYLEPNRFGPNDTVTRGEFATMLVKIMDIPLNYDRQRPSFDDVPPFVNLQKFYDYRYIETAAKAGIIRGKSERYFGADEPITREQAALMIARAANLKMGNDQDKALAALRGKFTDADSIQPIYLTAVEAVVKAGLIEGIENVLMPGQTKPTLRFDPNEGFKREQAAVIAVRLLKQLKKIPK